MKTKTVTMLGGTGFVGVQLATRLNALGYTIKVLTRHKSRHNELLVLSNVELVEADTHKEEALEQHFANSDIVVNLVGILNEEGNTTHTFYNAHVELVRKIVTACNNAGVPRYLHMSALNADAEKGTSQYLRTKGEGEKLAFELANENLAVTAFRPSVIFGPEDSFFNRFAGLLKALPFMPLACPDSRMAPVYIGDVVESFASSLDKPDSIGKSFDLVGPKEYTLEELVNYTARMIGKNRRIIRLPDAVAKLQGRIMGLLPNSPFSMDNYLSLQTDSISKDESAKQKTSIEAIVPGYLGANNRNTRLQSYRENARRDE